MQHKRAFFFYQKGEVIKNVEKIKYLGTVLSRTGSFTEAKKHLSEQARKNLYSVTRKFRIFNLPVNMSISYIYLFIT